MHDLLRNALSSIRMGVEDCASESSERPSSAARNIHAGLLLLYKEKLRRLSPPESHDALMMESVRPALSCSGAVVWVGSGTKTAGRQLIQRRLEALGIVVDWKRFDRVARLRHQIEHHYSDATADTMREVVANAFVLIRDFLDRHLQTDPLEALGHDTWQAMLETADVFQQELQRCIDALEAHAWDTNSAASIVADIRCAECESSLVEPVPGSETFRCRACGATLDLKRVIEVALEALYGFENYRSVKHGGEPETADCPECGASAFIFTEGECAVCGYQPSYSDCGRCGASITLEEQDLSGFCSYCHHLLNKDDLTRRLTRRCT